MTVRRIVRGVSALLVSLALLAPSTALAADKPIKATCLVDVTMQLTPGLNALPEVQRGIGFGSMLCRVKPSGGQVFSGYLAVIASNPQLGSCSAGLLRGSLGMQATAPDGSWFASYPSFDGSWDHGLLQASVNDPGPKPGSLTGVFLPLLPGACLPGTATRATGVELVFELVFTLGNIIPAS